MKRKQLVTYILLGAGGLVLLGVGGLLVRSIAQYREREKAFTRLRSQLGQLYRSEVFPSEENVALEHQNQAQLENWFDSMIAKLGEENISRDDRSPSQFIGRLERIRATLRQQADRARIRLPEASTNFAFGFERYTGTGLLPSPDDVPRLTEQLIIIRSLTALMLESEVSALRGIQRDIFEDAAAAPAVPDPTTPRRVGVATPAPVRRADARQVPQVPRQPGLLRPDDMFATYRFVLEFDAREEALAKLLNAFASHQMYIVVRSVRLRKDVPEMVAARPAVAGGGGGSGAAAEVDLNFLFGGAEPRPAVGAPVEPARPPTVLGASQPVSGIDMETPLLVRMEIDVYKFRSADETRD